MVERLSAASRATRHMIDSERPDYGNTPAADQRPRFDYRPAGEDSPHVSIVTPFFNPGPEFNETVRSVFRQSYQQWEWLIVDDGSTDADSLERLARCAHADRRVRVIAHSANRGLSAARNTGFREARCDLVLQLDADDLLEPTAIEKWCWYLDTHPRSSFVKGYSVGFGAHQYLWTGGFHLGRAFLSQNQVNPTVLIRRAVHEAVGGYDESDRGGLADWRFWLQCASRGYWGSTIPEYLDWYRRREDHTDRWPDFDDGVRTREYGRRLRIDFASLWTSSFPEVLEPESRESTETLPSRNRLSKSQPRLLFVLPWFTMGGADKFNLDVLQELTGRGWEVTVVSTVSSRDNWMARFAASTPDVFALHRFLQAADWPRFLAYLIQSRRPDALLLTHSEFGYRLLPWLRARFPDLPVLDYVHVVEPTWNDGGHAALSVRHSPHLDLSVAASAQVRDWMVERGVDEGRAEVCYLGVETARYRPDPDTRAAVRKEIGVMEHTPVLLFAGRLCPQKQPDVLALTLGMLQRKSVQFECWVAGDGPDRERLRRLLRAQGVGDQVRLLGEQSPEEVRRLMTAADLLFLPSRYEGIALVLYEAMACGLPVVTANVGGQRELVTPSVGVLIEPSDERTEAANYATALTELLVDAGRRQRLGEAGRALVGERFRLDLMGTRMAALITKARGFQRQAPRAVGSPEATAGDAAAAVALVARFEPATPDKRHPLFQEVGRYAHGVLSRWYKPIHDLANERGWLWLQRLGARARLLLLHGRR